MADYEVDANPDQENADIFQSNIRQIETTNRLLAHIEDKLNNLIYNKKQSPKANKFSTFTKKNAESQQAYIDKNNQDFNRGKSSFHENINQNDFIRTNKVNQAQTGQFFHQGALQQQPDEFQENYINNSNYSNQYSNQPQLFSNSTRNLYKSNQNPQGVNSNKNNQSSQMNSLLFNPQNNGITSTKSNRSQSEFQPMFINNLQRVEDNTSSNRNKFDELNYLLLGREDQDPSPSQISSGNNQQILGGTLEYTKSNHFNSANKQLEIDSADMNSYKSRQQLNQDNKFNNQESQRISDKLREANGLTIRSPQNQLFQKPQNNDELLVQRIDRMDKFYENKIKILSERVSLLEKENQVLIEQKSDLNLEVIKLKQNIPLSSTSNHNSSKFSTHDKTSKEQERKIIRLEQQIQELSLQNSNLEKEKKVLVDSLQHEIQELKNQNFKLIDENQSLRQEMRERNMSSSSMRRQGSNNSLINYYKGNHQLSSQTQRNNYQQNDDISGPIKTFDNTANILEDMRNKYNIPKVTDKKPQQNYEEDLLTTGQYTNIKNNVKDGRMTLNEIQHKKHPLTNETSQQYLKNKQSSDVSFQQGNQEPHYQQFKNNYESLANQNSQQYNTHSYQGQSYQQDSKALNENSYSFLEEPSTRRNRINQGDNLKEEISKIKDELVRQKVDNTNMVQKINDFKNQNGISHSSQNGGQNHQSNIVAPTEAQVMLENYKLYASQLEKSYEKIEQLYQKEVQDKQQRIEELSKSINQKKCDLEEESQYRLKPKLKTTKSRKTSVNKKPTKTTNSITTLHSIGRSKSVINTSKKI
ncbi:hypothetical protein TTHERM_00723340 (macronuclear) [Tetrahymena thermophila SB210]|uniref:Uncharacterized protein n=1 Tax=Tetrahymena thermophila (strain SB210) TaxID=312017 RepID=I7MFR2_TETTS|nr:hypothetical protein TTHERM_00723340 [Tetrahymena thermophila SB210]EAR84149.2 hypothetical protein TTHERM_00723340 [Tetrahymena thermophila SB210]|eukprot:XP_001031812.2 hypothetical protein TTHERM_00723340 [Tetrahymena thermophila SB210]